MKAKYRRGQRLIKHRREVRKLNHWLIKHVIHNPFGDPCPGCSKVIRAID